MNWYAYVGGDPVNFVDPLGLNAEGENNDLVVTGERPKPIVSLSPPVFDGGGGGNYCNTILAWLCLTDGGAGGGGGGGDSPAAGDDCPQPHGTPGIGNAGNAEVGFLEGVGASFLSEALRRSAREQASARYGGSGGGGDGSIGDAYRHFAWSFMSARLLSAQTAEVFGDANEVGEGNRGGLNHIMDDHNNSIGRGAALDRRFRILSPSQAFDILLARGCIIVGMM